VLAAAGTSGKSKRKAGEMSGDGAHACAAVRPGRGWKFALAFVVAAFAALHAPGFAHAATPLTITCPSPVVFEATGPLTLVPDMSAAATTTGDGVTVTGPGPLGLPIGTVTVTYTATDSSGGSRSCQTQITVADTLPPAINCSPVTAQATGNSSAVVDPRSFVTAVDTAAGGNVLVTTPPAGPYPLGTTFVTATATDPSGNSSSCLVAITVVDTVPPTIQCPAPISVTGPSGTAVTYAADAADAGSSITVSYSPASGSPFPLGITTVTATATDSAGNTASCNFTVEVRAPATTPLSLCLLTKQYIQDSNKYKALKASQRSAIDATATALCQKLAEIVPTLKPAQKANVINAYKLGVQALVPLGWLTAAQATTLIGLANTL
jgi:hypothetical protein